MSQMGEDSDQQLIELGQIYLKDSQKQGSSALSNILEMVARLTSDPRILADLDYTKLLSKCSSLLLLVSGVLKEEDVILLDKVHNLVSSTTTALIRVLENKISIFQTRQDIAEEVKIQTDKVLSHLTNALDNLLVISDAKRAL